MDLTNNGHASVGTAVRPGNSRSASGTPTSSLLGLKVGSRGRRHNVPVPVEATVYWWRSDEHRAACASPSQFGIMPATPVRFRCVGTLTPKYPQRYRVDLARALDWLPYLARNELKELGASLALMISKKLGVEVAPIAGDVIDLDQAGASASLPSRDSRTRWKWSMASS